jgi:hypothetical protein
MISTNFKIFLVKIRSDSLKPVILKIISESKSKAIDTVCNLYYPFPKCRDNVIFEILKQQEK